MTGQKYSQLLAAILVLLTVESVVFGTETSTDKPDYLGKRYKFYSMDNFDELLKVAGVPKYKRMLKDMITPIMPNPTVMVTENNGEYIVECKIAFLGKTIKFRPGEEFDDVDFNGMKVKGVITLDGNKMLHVKKGTKVVIIEREFFPTEMISVYRIGDVAGTVIFKLDE